MCFGPEMTQDDHKWLMQWQMHMFPLAKRDRMIKDALWVFSRKKDAAERNALTLVAMSQAGVPMVYCCSVDTGPCSKKAFVRSNVDGVTPDVQGLEMKSVLCRGAHVTLLFNHYVEWNLFNGSQGQVVDIIYLNGRSPSVEGDSFPDLYMVRFPQYKGPAVVPWDPKVVPVVPVTKKHECAHAYCSRTQVPLLPDYGRTVHKCQGMTCGPGHPRECLVTDLGDIGTESHAPGIAFVALSRITDVAHLGITGALNRIQKIGTGPKYTCVRLFDHKVKESSKHFLQKYSFLDNDESLEYLVWWAKSFPSRRQGIAIDNCDCPKA
mmetsp:Transcript_66356/g.163459  ORF Transcript_66356/g.163459 Transcript_66356/m.163459 type:complete len:322 (+) Transcript_66356:915-1880(+)